MSSLDDPYRIWRSKVLKVIHASSSELKKQYSSVGRLDHYDAVAEDCLRSFGNGVLCRAAFLHGIPSDILSSFDAMVSPEIVSILRNRETLTSLNTDVPDLRLQVSNQILPTIKSPEAVFLFLLEQRHHLDPTGKFYEWVKDFHRAPRKLNKNSAPTPTNMSQERLSELPQFCRSVLSPVAAYYGLCHDKALADDTALYLEQGSSKCFDEIVDFTINVSSITREIASLINSALFADSKDTAWSNKEVAFVWHAVSDIYKRFYVECESYWCKNLGQCGFVVVVCSTLKECYEGVYLLRRSPLFNFRNKKIMDYSGCNIPGVDDAVVVILELSSGIKFQIDCNVEGRTVDLESIEVRFVLKESDEAWFSPSAEKMLSQITDRIKSVSSSSDKIKVFTPEGLAIELPPGATVLHFARKLNRNFIHFLRGATVNKRSVDIFRPLVSGDVVWLDKGPIPKPLPPDWEVKFSSFPELKSKLKKSFKDAFRPFLEKRGAALLKAQVIGLGFNQEIDNNVAINMLEHTLDVLDLSKLDKHLQVLPKSAFQTLKGGKLSPVTWWLRQIGIYAYRLDDANVPFQAFIKAEHLESITALIAESYKKSLLDVEEYNIPAEYIDKLVDADLCEKCLPSVESWELLGSIEGNKLVLHHHRQACSNDVFPVTKKRSFSIAYFFLTLKNGAGALERPLSIFREYNINCVETVARNLNSERSIARILAQNVSPSKVQQIIKNLKGLDDCIKVYGPTDKVPFLLESTLPSRIPMMRTGLRLPSPYRCGESLEFDHEFYGMEQERTILQEAFNESAKSGVQGGRHLFITGPRRIGKSSLALWFNRWLGLMPRVVSVYCQAIYQDTWFDVQRELKYRLIEQLRDLHLEPFIPEIEPLPLIEACDQLQKQEKLSLVFIVDEATGMLSNIHSPDENAIFRRFASSILSKARRLVLWVGPKAEVRQIKSGLSEILLRAQPIHVNNLSLDETSKLLSAAQCDHRYSIKVSRSLVKTVYYLTKGNPYWVSHLGQKLWQIASRKSLTTVEYQEALLNKALDMVLQEGVAFIDRVRGIDSGTQEGNFIWSVLTIFSQSFDQRNQDEVFPSEGLTFDDILSGLRAFNVITTENMLKSALEDLSLRGTLYRVSADRNAWELAAPILARYINFKNS